MMNGKATKKFFEKLGNFIVEPQKPLWPFLWQLVERKDFLYVDYLLARKICSNGSESTAALVCILSALGRKGHLCLKINSQGFEPSLETICADAKMLQELKNFIREGAKDCDANLPIVHFQDLFYLEKNWAYETTLLEQIHRLLKSSVRPLKRLTEPSSKLTSEQKKAVENANRFGLSIITGGPGTGKTFTAGQIVNAFLDHPDVQVILTAPTGKAASRLKASIGTGNKKERICSGTLHHLLNIHPSTESSKDSLMLDADLVIVDECSMIDAELFSNLLSAIKNGSRLVLMGDPDQLPPIEAGSFFADLVHAKEKELLIPCTSLTQFLRSDQKEIHDLSVLIKSGNSEKITCTSNSIVKWVDLGLKRKNVEESYRQIWQHVKTRFALPSTEKPNVEYWLQKLNDFCILSTLRKGPFGVDALNQMLSQSIFSLGKKGDYCAIPIMITRNDIEMDLFNGEMGVLITKLEEASDAQKKQWRQIEAIFQSREENALRRILPSRLPEFEYAFCLSVHKSQGSEYNHLLILMPEGSEVFGRELLYTAVTRAKKSIELDADAQLIGHTLKKISMKVSGLRERL